MRQIKYIIIHCSATAEGKDFCAKDIDRWHRARGWNGIGYHYVVRLDGTIEKGRDVSKVGAHCAGVNSISVGVCYIGGLAADGRTPKDTRTPQQRDALHKLIKQLRVKYPQARIVGHNHFNKAKACPCYDVEAECKALKFC